MRFFIATAFLFIATAALPGPAHVDAQPADELAGMSGMEILDGLTSQDPGIRDRAKQELPLMGEAAAQSLGREILRAGVREAQIALQYLGNAACANAVHAALAGLEDEEYEVRSAGMDALVQLSPKHTFEAGDKPFKPEYKQAIRKLINDSEYIEDLCGSVTRDREGKLRQPVTQALRLMTLMDHLFGDDGMSLVLLRVGEIMLGEPLDNDDTATQTDRNEDERLRRAAAMWCQAIWITDPAIAFNYSPVAPYEERKKAIGNLREKLKELGETDISSFRKEYGKVKRFGDYLLYVPNGDYVNETKIAAYIRLQWWRGKEVPVEGEGYSEAVEGITTMRRREKSTLYRKLAEWWLKRRGESARD